MHVFVCLYYRLCAHAQSCARLGFVHVADSCDVEEAPARHKITSTPPCVLRENVPSFDRSIDTPLLESMCEEVGQDLVSKLWFSAPGPNRTVPHRTVPNRTYSTTPSGLLVVRFWFTRGTLEVRYCYSTVL